VVGLSVPPSAYTQVCTFSFVAVASVKRPLLLSPVQLVAPNEEPSPYMLMMMPLNGLCRGTISLDYPY
jgi:hypothetical protein